MHYRLSVGASFSVLLMSSCWIAKAAPDLDYQRRGDRSEGVKRFPISSYDIDLLSAMAVYPAYQKETSGVPPRVRLHFFLSGAPSHVAITVREVDNKDYYWLDNVTPSLPWHPGFNDFSWTTNTVLQPLHTRDGLNVSDLGVVANLQSSLPSGDMTVAPVLIGRDRLPAAVGGYEFAFKTDRSARLMAGIYGTASHPFSMQLFPHVAADAPFRVIWNCTGAPNGWYRLVIKGYALDNNDLIELVVHFYHHRAVS